MPVEYKFALTIAVIILSMAAGVIVRHLKLLCEMQAKPIMAGVTIVGYPLVGLLAVWVMKIESCDAWLPVIGFIQALLLGFMGLFVGKRMFKDRQECGLLGFSCTVGNHGPTMVGFVVYLLAGAQGLGLNTIYALYTFLTLVVVMYPIALHFSPDAKKQSLPKLLVRSILNIRSIGLVACFVGIGLSIANIPQPQFFQQWNILEIAIYGVIISANFAVGLRLHVPHIFEIKRLILSVLIIRHVIGLAMGFAFVAVFAMTPFELTGTSKVVVMLQSSAPVGVMTVAVANMFHIHPQKASMVFVVSSLLYLLIGLPLTVMIYG
ncbi:MAG: hypothetical protein KAR11_04835 [Phycisphaerae bacterium]|nr:hypothetical protein [Phycisphaerae bacterium]